MKWLVAFAALVVAGSVVMAQDAKHVVVLGSSTAEGAGASSRSKSWVGLYGQYVRSLNPRNRLTNLARGGYTPEKLLPAGDPNCNITRAIELKADLVIVNLPLGIGAGQHKPAESFLEPYRELKRIAGEHGVEIWFTTSTPKNNVDDPARVLLAEYRRRIKEEFAPRVIDFWAVTAEADGRIPPKLNADGTHFNDAGHRLLFEEAVRTGVLGERGIPSPSRILFIGNSLTYEGGGIDTAFVKLAQAGGQAVHVQREAPGGMSLTKHLARQATIDAVKSRAFDYVVIQGFSAEPINDPKGFAQGARGLAALARANGAKPILYMTWTFAQDFRGIQVADGAMTAGLDRAYSAMGRELKVPVVPAGLAFQKCRDQTAIHLYMDTHHQNRAGAYLVACTFYATLYGRSPVGLSWRGEPALDEAQARTLQGIAWETHLEYDRR